MWTIIVSFAERILVSIASTAAWNYIKKYIPFLNKK